MDGANMNAQVGLVRPADVGADVCHLNLHKTFCIPMAVEDRGWARSGVAAHLDRSCRTTRWCRCASNSRVDGGGGPWGSAWICRSPWPTSRSWGARARRGDQDGDPQRHYMARRLAAHYPLLYTGQNGLIAHEVHHRCRPFKASAGIEVEDIAKRISTTASIPPTVSFPVAGTLMIEPTESESKEELDRFCDALISIRQESARWRTGRSRQQHTCSRMRRTR